MKKFFIEIPLKIKDKLVQDPDTSHLLNNLLKILINYETNNGRMTLSNVLDEDLAAVDDTEIQPRRRLGLPPMPGKKTLEGGGGRNTTSSSIDYTHQLRRGGHKRSQSTFSDSRTSLEPRPREMFTDALIKSLKNLPSCTQYNVRPPLPKVPLGKFSIKAPGHRLHTDVQHMGMTLPGPAAYTPKKEVVLRNFGSFIKYKKDTSPTPQSIKARKR